MNGDPFMAELRRLQAENRALHSQVGVLTERVKLDDIAIETYQARITALENDLADALDLKNGCGPTVLTAMKQRITQLEAQLLRWGRWTPEHNIEQWLREEQQRLDEAQQRITQLEADIVRLRAKWEERRANLIEHYEQRITQLEGALKEQMRQMDFPDLPPAFAATMKRMMSEALA
jgi:DNA repair ATPase RecN